MSAKKNKVKFNICNVHYALLTVSEDGEVTFGTPVAMPGAVSLSLEPNGEPSFFTQTGMPIRQSPITWAMKGIWSLPWCRRDSEQMC